MSKPFFVKLPNRGLIHIEGKDRYDFLQGLISNDIKKLKKEKILYACFLTPQGKFLHDFFIHDGPNVILLDCEGGERAQDLYRRLNMYRLRSDIQLSVEDNHPVYGVFYDKTGLADPRHPDLGNRSFEKPNIEESDFKQWDLQRIKLGIPDGSRDMVPERSTLLESNIHQCNGIDWDKGCYMGQELTARMYHRNLGKKHLQTVNLDQIPAGADLRSSCDNIGLALIRKESQA